MNNNFRIHLDKFGRSMGVFLLSLALPVAACSPPEVKLSCEFTESSRDSSVEQEIAIVLAPSDKFVDFKSATAIAKSEIAEVIKAGNAKVSLILADGEPRLVANRYVDVSGQFTETGKNQEIDNSLAVVDRVVKCVELNDQEKFPYTKEIDFLNAIQVGANSFTNESSEKHIFVIGNGLQTKGAFNFIKRLNADTVANDGMVKDLVDKKITGNLKGAKVTWIGLGQTRKGDQQPLDENARSTLMDFWIKVVAAAGGNSSGILAGGISEGTTPKGGIPTSVVPFEVVEVCIEPITVTSDQGFEFNDDVATFMDPLKAKSSADQIKRQLEVAECLKEIIVTGYVASGGSEQGCARLPGFGEDLSLKRANAFKNLLQDAGVTIQITSVSGGLGKVPDCVNGVGDEDLMKQNRIAVITERK